VQFAPLIRVPGQLGVVLDIGGQVAEIHAPAQDSAR
jgi:hypothetical protein